VRLEIGAKSVERANKVAMLPRTPALRFDEESMLDGVARGARLSRRSARTGRARGVVPIGRQPACGESERAAFAMR